MPHLNEAQLNGQAVYVHAREEGLTRRLPDKVEILTFASVQVCSDNTVFLVGEYPRVSFNIDFYDFDVQS